MSDRAAVEQALVVTSSKPAEGAWSWVSDTEVHYRPKEYWPAYTQVTLDVQLKDVDAGSGVWGMANRTVKFRTGSSMVSVVDVDAHTLTVYRNGKVARVIPVTTGKAGFLTRNGIKVILEKHTLKIMDASTIGISQERPRVLPARGPLRDAGHLERRVRARRAVVGRQTRAGPTSATAASA